MEISDPSFADSPERVGPNSRCRAECAKGGHNRTKPDKTGQNRAESGQNATILYGISSYTKECQGALFSQIPSCHTLPLTWFISRRRGIKNSEKPEKMSLVRQRRRTNSQFHSTWWFAGWPLRIGKTGLVHFSNLSSYTAIIRHSSSSPAAITTGYFHLRHRHAGPRCAARGY